MYQFAFEKLDVWQDARKLVKEIYVITNTFPIEERFGLISQIRRSALSVCANLAEGSTRKSFKEQAHFTTIAYGSLIELLSHLMLSEDLVFINNDALVRLRGMIQPLSVRINNLRNTQTAKPD